MPERTDSELLLLLREDDMQAFKAIYDRYWHKLFCIAVRKLPAKEDASDMVQDLFLQIWKKRADLYITDSFDAYLFISLKNRIFSFYKKKQSEKTKHLTIVKNSPAVGHADGEVRLTTKELQGMVQNEIEAMPDRMRQVYKLSRQEHLSSQAIADQLSISDQTVRNQISTALKRIKLRLQINT